jgi:hypothetical protein
VTTVVEQTALDGPIINIRRTAWPFREPSRPLAIGTVMRRRRSGCLGHR